MLHDIISLVKSLPGWKPRNTSEPRWGPSLDPYEFDRWLQGRRKGTQWPARTHEGWLLELDAAATRLPESIVSLPFQCAPLWAEYVPRLCVEGNVQLIHKLPPDLNDVSEIHVCGCFGGENLWQVHLLLSPFDQWRGVDDSFEVEIRCGSEEAFQAEAAPLLSEASRLDSCRQEETERYSRPFDCRVHFDDYRAARAFAIFCSEHLAGRMDSVRGGFYAISYCRDVAGTEMVDLLHELLDGMRERDTVRSMLRGVLPNPRASPEIAGALEDVSQSLVGIPREGPELELNHRPFQLDAGLFPFEIPEGDSESIWLSVVIRQQQIQLEHFGARSQSSADCIAEFLHQKLRLANIDIPVREADPED